MTEQVKNNILIKISEIEDTLSNYYDKTVEILDTDIDETLEQITADREELLQQIKNLRGELDLIMEECTPEEKKTVDNAMTNSNVSLLLSPELREIRKAIVKMRSVYLKIAEKEKQAEARVDARTKELRAELEDLSGNRKTLDYFSRNKLDTTKGGSFDSHL